MRSQRWAKSLSSSFIFDGGLSTFQRCSLLDGDYVYYANLYQIHNLIGIECEKWWFKFKFSYLALFPLHNFFFISVLLLNIQENIKFHVNTEVWVCVLTKRMKSLWNFFLLLKKFHRMLLKLHKLVGVFLDFPLFFFWILNEKKVKLKNKEKLSKISN